VDPSQGLDGPHDLLIVNGKIKEVRPLGSRLAGTKGRNGKAAAPAGTQVIDLDGAIVVPGLVDMHVHLREPGQ